jgi:hypothetical protein
MNNGDIADLLADYRRAKNETSRVRAELVRLAVEEMGVPQQDALKMSLDTFFDGYLVGQCVRQSWRD